MILNIIMTHLIFMSSFEWELPNTWLEGGPKDFKSQFGGWLQVSHQSRKRWLGIKTRHSKARFLRGLPRIQKVGDVSWQWATLRRVNSKGLTDSEIHKEMVIGGQAQGAEEG